MNAVALFNPSFVLLIARWYEEVSVGAVATPLDATMAKNCFRATFKVDGGGTARYRIDGGIPSATVGIPIYDGEQLELSQADARAFLAFRVGGTNPILRVTYLAPLIT